MSETPSRIRITNYPSFGVKTEIDGQELQEVRSVHFSAPAYDEVPTLTIEINAIAPYEINVNANVVINLHILEECEIIDVTTNQDESDSKRRLVVRTPS